MKLDWYYNKEGKVYEATYRDYIYRVNSFDRSYIDTNGNAYVSVEYVAWGFHLPSTDEVFKQHGFPTIDYAKNACEVACGSRITHRVYRLAVTTSPKPIKKRRIVEEV